jgi:alanine racemase
MMMMIKASAYGVGVQPIAQWAEKTHLIDYLGVAYTMEGIELRQSAITLPIMVVNIDQTDFNTCQEFNLEPVIYSISLFKKFIQWMEKNDNGKFFHIIPL